MTTADGSETPASVRALEVVLVGVALAAALPPAGAPPGQDAWRMASRAIQRARFAMDEVKRYEGAVLDGLRARAAAALAAELRGQGIALPAEADLAGWVIADDLRAPGLDAPLAEWTVTYRCDTPELGAALAAWRGLATPHAPASFTRRGRTGGWAIEFAADPRAARAEYARPDVAAALAGVEIQPLPDGVRWVGPGPGRVRTLCGDDPHPLRGVARGPGAAAVPYPHVPTAALCGEGPWRETADLPYPGAMRAVRRHVAAAFRAGRGAPPTWDAVAALLAVQLVLVWRLLALARRGAPCPRLAPLVACGVALPAGAAYAFATAAWQAPGALALGVLVLLAWARCRAGQ